MPSTTLGKKLNTRRGRRRFETNAWCWVHRTPMQKHGANFTCVGHWSTRVHSALGERFTNISLATTGWRRRYEGTRQTYPWCVRCRKRMWRHAVRRAYLSWMCGLCKDIASSRVANERFEFSERQRKAKAMIRAGYENYPISKRIKIHFKNVKALRAEIPDEEIARCVCGRVKFHYTACAVRRDVRSISAQNRSDFDNLRVKISRALPARIPNDYREDIIQDVISVVLESTNEVIRRMTQYRIPWISKTTPEEM